MTSCFQCCNDGISDGNDDIVANVAAVAVATAVVVAVAVAVAIAAARLGGTIPGAAPAPELPPPPPPPTTTTTTTLICRMGTLRKIPERSIVVKVSQLTNSDTVPSVVHAVVLPARMTALNAVRNQPVVLNGKQRDGFPKYLKEPNY